MQLDLFGNRFVQPDRDTYSTPQPLYDEYNAEFDFQIDAAASRLNKKCDLYFGLDHAIMSMRDALKLDWVETAERMDVPPTFWLNPPYSFPLIEQFMAKAYEESLKGATVACLVIPSTCSNWWHDYALKGELRWIRGRVNFVPPPGVKASTNSRDSVIVVFKGVS